MNVRRHALALALSFAVASTAWADPRGRIAIDIDELAVGQSGTFEVIVRGATPRARPEVTAPPGLQVAFIGQQQQTTVVNGRMDQFVSFKYELVARRVGRWQLGPATVLVDDGQGGQKPLVIQSLPFTVHTPDPTTADATASDGLAVEVAFAPPTAWQGQVVVLGATLIARVPVQQARWVGLPTAHLLAPRDGTPEQKAWTIQDERGPMRMDASWTPWVVTDAGHLTWDPPLLQAAVAVSEPRGGGGMFGMFQRTRAEVVPGPELSLDVRPLPPPPPGFSGLVGDFTLVSRVERQRPTVGASIEWLTRVSGDGALEGLDLPDPPPIDGARLYDGTPQATASVQEGRYDASVVLRRTIVPTRTGRVDIPPIELVVFSPTKGAYETLRSNDVTLDVKPGEAGAVDVQSFAPDGAAPIEAAPEDALRPAMSGPAWRVPAERVLPSLIVLAALPAVGLGGLSTARAAAAAARARRQQTPRAATPLERLDALPEGAEARLAALDDALRAGLAAHAEVPVHALDVDAVLGTLAADVADELRSVRRSLDRARFAGQPAPDDVVARTRALLLALERA